MPKNKTHKKYLHGQKVQKVPWWGLLETQKLTRFKIWKQSQNSAFGAADNFLLT